MPLLMRCAARLASIVIAMGVLLGTSAYAATESVSTAQRRAAAEFLAAKASGDAQAVAFALHPQELDLLRNTLLQRLRDEASRSESGLRGRLFGEAMPLAEIERMTTMNFFRALSRRLEWRGRSYANLDGVAGVRHRERTLVLVEGTAPEGQGTTRIVEVVALLPDGKDWKAALPDEWRAQIDDLVAARSLGRAVASGASNVSSVPVGSATSGRSSPVAGTTAAVPPRNPPGVLALLDAAEKALVANRCDRYYREHLSPDLRDSLSGRTLDTLIKGCERSMAQRELLIAALRIVRRSTPRFEAGGTRAIYDVSGQGLPYDEYVLAQVGERWYIAE